jgi:AcrR family transcriptional regulator
MGPSDRQANEKAQRREQMLDAAERLFGRLGFDGTTMDAVAAEAEFTKRTLYQYFASKEALVAELAVRGLAVMNRMTEEAVAAAPTGLLQAGACGQAFFDFQRRHAAVYALMQRAHSVGLAGVPAEIALRLQAADEHNFALLQHAIEAGVADGSIRRELEPFQTALLVRSLSVGLVQTVNQIAGVTPGGFPLDRERFLDDALAFLGAALSPTSLPLLRKEVRP